MKSGNSVEDRVAAFFVANPTEELTIADIMVKFDCSRTVAAHAVSPARCPVVLERISIYRLKQAAKP